MRCVLAGMELPAELEFLPSVGSCRLHLRPFCLADRDALMSVVSAAVEQSGRASDSAGA